MGAGLTLNPEAEWLFPEALALLSIVCLVETVGGSDCPFPTATPDSMRNPSCCWRFGPGPSAGEGRRTRSIAAAQPGMAGPRSGAMDRFTAANPAPMPLQCAPQEN